MVLGNGQLFEHWLKNQEGERVRFFSKDTIPPIFTSPGKEYALGKEVIIAAELWNQPFKPISEIKK